VAQTEFTRKVKIKDSSNLSAVDYDPVSKDMRVDFANGETYIYHKVPASTFGTIVSSESVGVSFQQLVRQNKSVKYEKVS
jgi:hypothetical protein